MPDAITILLPDGSARELPPGSTGADLAASIGRGLAKAAVAETAPIAWNREVLEPGPAQDGVIRGITGEIEGRAAFFDLSLDGRWGGIITGDKISLDFDPCACGAKSPSIRDNIVRYADLEGDDKIGCAGTVDAYVRGLS